MPHVVCIVLIKSGPHLKDTSKEGDTTTSRLAGTVCHKVVMLILLQSDCVEIGYDGTYDYCYWRRQRQSSDMQLLQLGDKK